MKETTMEILKGIVKGRLETGKFDIKLPHIELEFMNKVQDGKNHLDVIIKKQSQFSINETQKTVLATVGNFNIASLLMAELREDTFFIGGLANEGEYPIKADNYTGETGAEFDIPDVVEYVTNIIVGCNKLSLDDKIKFNDILSMKKLVNQLSEKPIYHICQVCGEDVKEGETMCSKCRAMFVPCSECGQVHHKDELYQYKDTQLCVQCLQKNAKRESIVSYSEKVPPKFLGENGFHYGVEIEVERDSKKAKFSEQDIIAIMKKYAPQSYFKHDGSLSSGFEMITHPCTIDYHADKTVSIFPVLEKLGYGTSSGNCGLHIHVGRNAFGDGFKRKYSIGRLLWLQDKFKVEMKKICKRKKFRYCQDLETPSNSRIADMTPHIPQSLLGDNNISEKIKSTSNIALAYYDRCRESDRYRAINLCYSPTVEFRLPQGTMSTNDFMAYLQLWDSMIKIALDFTIDFSELQSIKPLLKGKYTELDILLDETI